MWWVWWQQQLPQVFDSLRYQVAATQILMSALVKWVYYVSSCNLKGDGLIANIIRLELYCVQNIKLDIIGIEKTYAVWTLKYWSKHTH